MAERYPPVIEGMVQTPHEEEVGNKFVRKVKENPIVPLGLLATAGVLGYGLINFKDGKSQKSQAIMRARIISQGLTVAILMGSVFMTSWKTYKSKSQD
ncbi:HIG1 domain family member 2A, mitochondrial [Eleutherodactylus coqui]|uniref:HIG1 domain-containing protein n=1 Tax=Eleutherodactylus coqui TaxID=57060 RepID=A0A8J6FML9_ELECQ|nr:hypothetical protein GDO78_006112 [Eleutherodactylus coqui]